MAALDFPTSPSIGQIYSANGKTFQWSGTSWVNKTGTGYTGSVGYTGSLGYTGSVGTGYTGSSGSIGYTGSRGYNGSQGYTGSIGLTGGVYNEVAKTTNYTVTAGEAEYAFTNRGATGSVTFTLPEISTVLGHSYTFVKVNSNNLVVQASSSQVIMDSSANGTLTNSVSTETYASVTLRAVQSGTSAYVWVITSGVGTWATA